MFSIFKRKEYLTEHLQGITDIHNHILPGIDDGAAGVQDSLDLLLKYHELGISSFIATPHIMNDYYPNTPQTIDNALRELETAKRNIDQLNDVKIKCAAEYMMDQHFLELIESENLLTLKDNFVLVEMSYFQAPINLNEILFKLQTMGYKPILAHPERYAFYHSKDLNKYEELKNRGCRFQINALSLTPHYGVNMQNIALKLLEKGMIDYIGTDTHRLQHLDKLESITINKKMSAAILQVIENTKEAF